MNHRPAFGRHILCGKIGEKNPLTAEVARLQKEKRQLRLFGVTFSKFVWLDELSFNADIVLLLDRNNSRRLSFLNAYYGDNDCS